ncbi:hypothetical protein [Marinobacter sp. ELB17]|uniref:hypothetical protein n=1 Tax=Marinobacter sp. ELB17 TaxID=270374 RepID=UPI0000F39AFB|nr:hypothetical protein [Marinobacter sp. ELB17]EAZ99744.1 hypothetical protein MELB17_12091 [Marinobacter sp. ELB17]
MAGNIKGNETQQLQTLKELEAVYDTEHEIGQHNIHPLGLELHNPRFSDQRFAYFGIRCRLVVLPRICQRDVNGGAHLVNQYF